MKQLVILVLLSLLCACASFQKAELNLVQEYIEKERYRQALYRIENTFRRDPSDPEVRAGYEYWRGRAYEGLGRTDEAIGTYRYLIEQFPDTKWGAEASDRLRLLNN